MTNEKRRLYLLDYFRLVCVFAVVQFHVYETLIYHDDTSAPAGTIHSYFFSALRSVSLGGHFVIALSAFLFGLGTMRARRWLILLGTLLFGVLTLALVEADQSLFYFEWDIYPFLLVSFAMIFLLSRYPRALDLAAGISFLALCLPLWNWIELRSAPTLLRDAIIGECGARIQGSWPLLPWTGLPILFFAAGFNLRHAPTRRAWFERWQRPDYLWLPVLAASIPWLGSYFPATAGPHYYCFMLRQSPLNFWAHFAWVVFIFRLALLTRTNVFLARYRLTEFVAGLAWCRHFGLCYIVHLFWLMIFSHVPEAASTDSRIFDFFYVILIPLTELTTRMILRTYLVIQPIFAKLEQ